MGDVDIEAYIAAQKEKLIRERKHLQNGTSPPQNGLPPQAPKENVPPRRRPETPQEKGLLGGKLGDYEEKRKKLDTERKAEYNRLMAEKNRRAGRRDDSSQAYAPTIPQLANSDSAEVRKTQTRNAEYNDFLKQKDEQERHKFDNRRPGIAPEEADMASLRTRKIDSAEVRRRRERERNDEYNEFLRYKDAQKRKNRGRDDFFSDDEQVRSKPRTGWATPTYEEILDRKRAEEQDYRRRNDPEYNQPMKLGGQNYLRSSVSDGFLNEEKRLNDLDREYDRKKTDFKDELRHPNLYSDKTPPLGILQDELWLSPRTLRHGAPARGAPLQGGISSNYQQPVNGHPLQTRDRPAQAQVNVNPTAYKPRQIKYGEGEIYATLPLGTSGPGHESTSSAKQRKKDQYRKDLEAQMSELANTKRLEKIRDLGDGRGVVPAPNQGVIPTQPARVAPPPAAVAPPVDPSRVYYNPSYPATAAPALVNDGPRGILNRGFDFPYGRPPPGRAPQPEANLLPNSLLNGQGQQGVPPLDLYRSPLDDAYYFYGTRNPLDIDVGAVPTNYGSQPRQEPPPVDTSRTRSRNRVNFDDSPRRAPTRNLNEFPSEDQQRSRSRSEKEQYQAELQRQIEERKRRKMAEKQRQEDYDRRKEEEIANYNPFGRGGGGAPIKDSRGNLQADLRSLRRDNEDPETPRRRLEDSRLQNEPQQPYVSPRGYDDRPRDKQEYGRAGDGFFGEPKSGEEKSASERYKEELQKQIDEKKRKKEEEEAKKKAEEEKELKKIEEDQQRMKEEFEAEQKRQKAKEEEEQRKNEEIKRVAEEKRKQAEHLKQEAEEKRQNELRERQDQERLARQRAQDAQRASSPPVPALRSKTTGAELNEHRSDSPPIPALRSKTEPDGVSLRGRTSPPVPAVKSQSRSEYRANSADVLSQLARMRQQLQNERLRVESALRHKKDEVDVSDPRLGPVRVLQTSESDLERRERLNSHNAAEFHRLKNKGSPSRTDFRSVYPEDPSTNDQLERQQRALLRQQQDQLHNLQLSSDGFPQGPTDGRPSPASRLHAETAYIDVESGIKRYPNDFNDLPSYQKNENARTRRREKKRIETPVSVISEPDPVPSARPTPRDDPMGSTFSLDADRITQKNQERLRRLRGLTGDEVSLADPDEVLNRFMAKQNHTRPASGQTLQDDTWLRPDSRS